MHILCLGFFLPTTNHSVPDKFGNAIFLTCSSGGINFIFKVKVFCGRPKLLSIIIRNSLFCIVFALNPTEGGRMSRKNLCTSSFDGFILSV